MADAPLTEQQDHRVQVALRVYCDRGSPADENDEAQAAVQHRLRGGDPPDWPERERVPHYRAVVHLLVPAAKFDEVRRVHFGGGFGDGPPPRCHCGGALSRSVVFRRLPIDLGAAT